jgi:WD40 repeat protein
LNDVNLAMAGPKPMISIWSLKSKQRVKQLIGHKSSVRALVVIDKLDLDDDNKQLASGSTDAVVKIWNCTSGRLVSNLTGHSQTVNDLVFLRTSDKIISCSQDSKIIIWNIKNGSVLKTLALGTQPNGVLSLSCCSLKNQHQLMCASAHENQTVFLWNIETEENLKTFNAEHGFMVSFLLNANLAYPTTDALIRIINVTSGVLVNSLSGHRQQVLYLIELKADYLASGSLDSSVKIWNYKSGECVRTLKNHANMVLCLGWLIHDRLLSGSADKTLKIWTLSTVFANQTTNLEFGM